MGKEHFEIINSELIGIIKEEDLMDIKQACNGTPWEWFVSLSLQSSETLHNGQGIDLNERQRREDQELIERADWCLKRWRRFVFDELGLQIGYQGVMLTRPSPHLHLLLVARRSRRRSLRTVPAPVVKLLQDRWFALAKRTCRIANITDREGIIDYLAGPRNLGYPGQRFSAVEQCNSKLLRRLSRSKLPIAA